MPLLSFQGVSKWFPHGGGRELLRTHMMRWLRSRGQDRFWALKNISFELEHGESMAVVGGNGAGKSTLLSMVAGLAQPNEGRVELNGRVAALLELGAGFHPDLTGAENLLLNAALLGLARRRAVALFDQIVEFSGIGEFIDEPLRSYSSGMIMRLGFSVAIKTEPDILLIDEVLAVGDVNFQTKCIDALAEFQRGGGSILFVSHSGIAVQRMCRRAIWLDHGELMLDGEASAVVDAYEGRAALK
jgi:lipopolysaccharide transport system ATP-binding protein